MRRRWRRWCSPRLVSSPLPRTARSGVSPGSPPADAAAHPLRKRSLVDQHRACRVRVGQQDDRSAPELQLDDTTVPGRRTLQKPRRIDGHGRELASPRSACGRHLARRLGQLLDRHGHGPPRETLLPDGNHGCVNCAPAYPSVAVGRGRRSDVGRTRARDRRCAFGETDPGRARRRPWVDGRRR